MTSRQKYPRTYRIWKNMRARCNAPCNADSNYQLNNIQVVKEWADFNTFLTDMNPAPEGWSIDRIDNSGDYCKENCRWASDSIQSNNRGEFNLMYTYEGETLNLKQWARKKNIKYNTLYGRVAKGMCFEAAITQIGRYKRKYNGKIQSVKEHAAEHNIKASTVHDRLYQGWSFKDALTKPVKGS